MITELSAWCCQTLGLCYLIFHPTWSSDSITVIPQRQANFCYDTDTVCGESLPLLTAMATKAESQMKLDSPAMAPPPGVLPNFVNPQNLRAVIIAIVALCGSISTLVFWMRMYTKLFIFRKTGWEDCNFCPLQIRCNQACY